MDFNTALGVKQPGGKVPFRYTALDGLLDISLSIVLVVGMLLVWNQWWTNVEGAQANEARQAELHATFDDEIVSKPAPFGVASDLGIPLDQLRGGQAFARVMIPALNQYEEDHDWQFAAVRGVSNAALLGGLGWYPQTQLPGANGNFVVAGHRDGRGAPFYHIDKLRPCDAIVVETATEWLTYRVLPVSGQGDKVEQAKACMPAAQTAAVAPLGAYHEMEGYRIINPRENFALAPVPSDVYIPADDAAQSLLTITTCHPLYENKQRYIVSAMLTQRTGKSPGVVPDALKT